ncbi:zinc finger protein [Aspergillus ellipticus CBS 707.79]|uniref:Zinc finger protein n=1 Tax=Aspergillus ellipticus CBS 707.79 TaxID=1448320 RepID=A0A319DHA7_9EURO|nr:zinc finger protein [Aspergillus ellipticus CBS 707.79]
MNSKNHWAPTFECETCDEEFYYERDAEEHMRDYGHHARTVPCETCQMMFRTQESANQHMSARGHWAPTIPCEMCDRMFHSVRAAEQHMDALGHWAPSVPCETCSRMFYTEGEAEQHMRKKNHFKNYCSSCDRHFQNENNLRMHLNSNIHRGQNIVCPFCRRGFTAASGLSHHLETGSCPQASNLNRETIYKIIEKRDKQGTITNKLLEWHSSNDSHYSVTDYAFNGDCWECYVCHRGFNTRTALNSHLNSPVHKQKLYRCPNSKQKCGKQFITLAALFGHLESESCAFMRFEKVQQQIKGVFNSSRSIAF